MSHPKRVFGVRRASTSDWALGGHPRRLSSPPGVYWAGSAAGWASWGVRGAGRWARVGGGGGGVRGERDGSQYLEAASCLLTRTSPGQITSQVTRCTQKGHGFLRAEACDACENADEGRSAAAPRTSPAARSSTKAARTAPVPVAEPLGCLHRRSSELREAHLRSRRAAEARPPRAGGWALCFTSRLK